MKHFSKSAVIFIMALTLVFTTATSSFAASAPRLKATSAIIYCASTDEVLWEKNADKKMNLASITKLMTCLIAASELGMDAKVTVDAEATNVTKSRSYVYAGEEITVRDLIYEALLVSANDAAKALAIAVSGSEKKFAKLMNAKAKEIGCTKTNFVNASGIKADNHYSTAEDISLIAKTAFANKDIRKIAGTPEYTVAATNKGDERKLETTNLFLQGGTADTLSGKIKVNKYKGVFAGKTGTTKDYKATMVVGCNVDGFEVYAVILGSTMEERYDDIKKLLDYAKESISKYSAFDKGDVLGQAKLKGGATNKVEGVAALEGCINLPEGASASLVTSEVSYVKDLKAPIKKGQKIGEVKVCLADDPVRTIDLLAAKDVKKGWFLSPLGITNAQTVILFIVLGLVLACFVGILALRAANKKKRKLARQAKLREIARRQMEREYDVRQRKWPY